MIQRKSDRREGSGLMKTSQVRSAKIQKTSYGREREPYTGIIEIKAVGIFKMCLLGILLGFFKIYSHITPWV